MIAKRELATKLFGLATSINEELMVLRPVYRFRVQDGQLVYDPSGGDPYFVKVHSRFILPRDGTTPIDHQPLKPVVRAIGLEKATTVLTLHIGRWPRAGEIILQIPTSIRHKIVGFSVRMTDHPKVGETTLYFYGG